MQTNIPFAQWLFGTDALSIFICLHELGKPRPLHEFSLQQFDFMLLFSLTEFFSIGNPYHKNPLVNSKGWLFVFFPPSNFILLST